jgi:hypothetical protein
MRLFLVLCVLLLAVCTTLATISGVAHEFQESPHHNNLLRSVDDWPEEAVKDCVSRRVMVRDMDLPVECMYHDGTYVTHSTGLTGTVVKGFGITYEASLKVFVNSATKVIERWGLKEGEQEFTDVQL